jgi:hypothetical protein
MVLQKTRYSMEQAASAIELITRTMRRSSQPFRLFVLRIDAENQSGISQA